MYGFFGIFDKKLSLNSVNIYTGIKFTFFIFCQTMKVDYRNVEILKKGCCLKDI